MIIESTPVPIGLGFGFGTALGLGLGLGGPDLGLGLEDMDIGYQVTISIAEHSFSRVPAVKDPELFSCQPGNAHVEIFTMRG